MVAASSGGGADLHPEVYRCMLVFWWRSERVGESAWHDDDAAQ